MADDDAPQAPPPAPAPDDDPTVYQFPVHRGMAVILVIETTFWYSGLLQAALARITLEGQN